MVLTEKGQILTLEVLSVGYRRQLAIRKLSTHSKCWMGRESPIALPISAIKRSFL